MSCNNDKRQDFGLGPDGYSARTDNGACSTKINGPPSCSHLERQYPNTKWRAQYGPHCNPAFAQTFQPQCHVVYSEANKAGCCNGSLPNDNIHCAPEWCPFSETCSEWMVEPCSRVDNNGYLAMDSKYSRSESDLPDVSNRCRQWCPTSDKCQGIKEKYCSGGNLPSDNSICGTQAPYSPLSEENANANNLGIVPVFPVSPYPRAPTPTGYVVPSSFGFPNRFVKGLLWFLLLLCILYAVCLFWNKMSREKKTQEPLSEEEFGEQEQEWGKPDRSSAPFYETGYDEGEDILFSE